MISIRRSRSVVPWRGARILRVTIALMCVILFMFGQMIPISFIDHLLRRGKAFDMRAVDSLQDMIKNGSDAHGKCRMMMSPWRDNMIGPKSVSDMTDWTFTRTRYCEAFSVDARRTNRSKFSLNNCFLDDPTISITQTTNMTDVFTLKFKDDCLSKFIESCCIDENPVPNVFHYVWFGSKELNFFNFLSLMSVHRFAKPCVILIHGPDLPRGRYWEYFLQLAPNVIHVYRERPTQVFGNDLRFKEHSSDVMRIEALLEYGGIYLDFDEVLLRPLDSLRRFQYTQGHELSFTMGSQLVMSKKNADFLQLWYISYRDDYRKIWAYNALWVPNTLAKRNPHLIHVEGYNFTRPSWKEHKLIFEGNYDWSRNYGMHMYARWYKKPIDTEIIRTLSTTIGSVSRHILFGNKELCIQ